MINGILEGENDEQIDKEYVIHCVGFCHDGDIILQFLSTIRGPVYDRISRYLT